MIANKKTIQQSSRLLCTKYLKKTYATNNRSYKISFKNDNKSKFHASDALFWLQTLKAEYSKARNV